MSAMQKKKGKKAREHIPHYFALLTPAPMTPGSVCSPTLKSRLMAKERTPTIVTVKPTMSQKGELMSFFWHMLPPQKMVLLPGLPSPGGRTCLWHWQAKQTSLVLGSLAYLSTQAPWPEHPLVRVSQLFCDWKHCGMREAGSSWAKGSAPAPAGEKAGRVVSLLELSERTVSAESRRRRSLGPEGFAAQEEAPVERLDSGSRTRAASTSPLETNLARRFRLETRVSMVPEA